VWVVRIGVKPGQWGWGFAELEASWRAAERAGFDVVSCFDHVTAKPAGDSASWDAPTLLCAMAGRTERAALSVDVINVALRNPFLLAAQLAVAQAASGGRLEVGLGAGSYHLARFDHEALGIPFPPYEERLARLEACCRVFPALWGGEEVTEPALGLDGASLGAIGIDPPPIVVGSSAGRALDVAARCADGWLTVVSTPEEFAELAARLPAGLSKRAQVFVRDVEPSRELVARLEEGGADTVTFVLTEDRGAAAVQRLASAVL
jgi:alkanesulfonate monooxygenase SsuD/methylene tetrahydromethanopterin reductase-like flavin-dependent oxidoreductase (luciferase family)